MLASDSARAALAARINAYRFQNLGGQVAVDFVFGFLNDAVDAYPALADEEAIWLEITAHTEDLFYLYFAGHHEAADAAIRDYQGRHRGPIGVPATSN